MLFHIRMCIYLKKKCILVLVRKFDIGSVIVSAMHLRNIWNGGKAFNIFSGCCHAIVLT